MKKRVYNFSAGPAALPLSVLETAQRELLNWQDRGLSLMELSHQTVDFRELSQQIEEKLRALLAIPTNYHLLFLSGGARVQFAMLALNLLRGKTVANYIDTGIWSQIAMKEASRYCHAIYAATSRSDQYTAVPDPMTWAISPDAAYCHYTDNETVQGIEFHETPTIDPSIPLIADMTSSLLSKPLAINRFGMVYAGTQKNVGIAGLTLVIVRHDLLGNAHPHTPLAYDYQLAAQHHSLHVTPPTYPWYMTGLLCDWLQAQGGIQIMAANNAKKAAKLYQVIDGSDGFYQNNIAIDSRSRMNVVFTIHDTTKEAIFLQEAEAVGLTQLKGHSLVGGLRASLYNAVSDEAVDRLVEFMWDFLTRYQT